MIILAQEEGRNLKHNYIGTEYILLALLREKEGLAARVLRSLDVTVDRVRPQVVRIAGSGEKVASGQIPFTPRAQKVREFAQREALSLEHDYIGIGTEHILLGLVRENEGVAARILLDFGADWEKIRNEIIRITPEHRRALAGTPGVRTLRAQLRRSLKSGAADPVEIFLHPPAGLETVKVFDLLVAVPLWGRVKATRALTTLGLSPTKTIGGLSERQRNAMADLLRRPRESPSTGG